jgi:ssDNA-binding Zn-finger/Zn-ribbon topoisomerase 1
MMSKTCPNCNYISYSANDKGKWECPKCGIDIRDVKINEEVKVKNVYFRDSNKRQN